MESKDKSLSDLSACDVTPDDVYEFYDEGPAFVIGCVQVFLAEVSVLTWACAVYFEAETDHTGADFSSYSLVCVGVWGGLYVCIRTCTCILLHLLTSTWHYYYMD